VWVLDINDFLLYLEDCLYRISPQFPWLLETQPINRNYPWTETDRFHKDKTQRDYLVDWILCFILKDFYYFDSRRDERYPEFQAIYNALENDFDLHKNIRAYTDFPRLYGLGVEIVTHQILRQSCWLYIEASYDPSQQPR
jgi:hypothetical protein